MFPDKKKRCKKIQCVKKLLPHNDDKLKDHILFDTINRLKHLTKTENRKFRSVISINDIKIEKQMGKLENSAIDEEAQLLNSDIEGKSVLPQLKEPKTDQAPIRQFGESPADNADNEPVTNNESMLLDSGRSVIEEPKESTVHQAPIIPVSEEPGEYLKNQAPTDP